jgi:hypothetical protein
MTLYQVYVPGDPAIFHKLYFLEAEADAAATLIADAEVAAVDLAARSAVAPAMYVNEIIEALKLVVGVEGGVILHQEAYPAEYPKDAQLPCCLYRFADFVDNPVNLKETLFQQTYQIDIFVVSKYDITTNTPAVGRTVAEAVRNVIKATPDLGLGTAYSAHPRRVTAENELQMFFRENPQPRQAHLIEVIIGKQEDER